MYNCYFDTILKRTMATYPSQVKKLGSQNSLMVVTSRAPLCTEVPFEAT